MKNFLKIVSVYVGAFFLAHRACVAYIWLLFKYAFICIPNTGRHIRIIDTLIDKWWFLIPHSTSAAHCCILAINRNIDLLYTLHLSIFEVLIHSGAVLVVIIWQLYFSCIYNYLCNQCWSPLKLWVRTPLMARCARYNIMW